MQTTSTVAPVLAAEKSRAPYNILSAYILDTELHNSARQTLQRQLTGHFLAKQPARLVERAVAAGSLSTYGKVFASAWVDAQTVVAGTKANKLLALSTRSLALQEILLPSSPQRPVEVSSSNHGVRAISISPCGRFLASGGPQPHDCCILELPSFRAVQTLAAHTDVIFGIDWVTEEHVVTGAKDKTIKLWKVSQHSPINYHALETRNEHEGKVRDIKYSHHLQRVMSLAYNAEAGPLDSTPRRHDNVLGQLVVRDACLQPVHTYPLPDRMGALACLAVDEHCIAVGSWTGVLIFDSRMRRHTYELPNKDGPSGPTAVRSLSLRQHLLSYGTGRGRLYFVDLRSNNYLEWSSGDCRLSERSASLQTSSGWIDAHDLQTYSNLLDPQRQALDSWRYRLEYQHHACFTHSWSPSGASLFTGGGPPFQRLSGCYMAVWD